MTKAYIQAFAEIAEIFLFNANLQSTSCASR